MIAFLIGKYTGNTDSSVIFANTAYVALFMCALMQGVKIWNLEKKLKPTFQVTCNKHADGCAVVSNLSFGNSEGKTVSLPSTFFRAIVEVVGIGQISECTAFITRIEKDSVVRMGHETLQITYAPGDEGDCLSKQLRDKVPAPLDVIAITESGQILFCTRFFKMPNAIDLTALFNERGNYIFTVVLTGKDIASQQIRLRFYWSGSRSSSELTLL